MNKCKKCWSSISTLTQWYNKYYYCTNWCWRLQPSQIESTWHPLAYLYEWREMTGKQMIKEIQLNNDKILKEQ